MTDRLGNFLARVWFFGLVPAGVLAGVIVGLYMTPSISTRVTCLESVGFGAAVVGLGLANVVINSVGFEKKAAAIATRLAMMALLLALNCVVFWLFGV